jgi:uncharacterized membrane protein (UPF0127 family)
MSDILDGLGLTKRASMIKHVPMKLVNAKGDEKGNFVAEMADDSEARRKGLSKRANLPDGSGMFFDTGGPFWMKDVRFPLDIVFLTKTGSVSSFHTMPVDTAPDWHKTLYSDKKAAYAVELPAGWCYKHRVIPGDRLVVACEN